MARPTVFALGFAAATSLAMLLAGCPATSNGPFFEVPDAALDATTADASGPAACVAADGQCLDEAGI
ncbi:MAG TPA: hypothetical protein VH044_02735, partial [Polyangiaceae bacterium]|nr:hypothetical protein [Polyangiaceae bacterium]